MSEDKYKKIAHEKEEIALLERNRAKRAFIDKFGDKFGDDLERYCAFMRSIQDPAFGKWFKKHPDEHQNSPTAIFYRLLTPQNRRLLKDWLDAEKSLVEAYVYKRRLNDE